MRSALILALVFFFLSVLAGFGDYLGWAWGLELISRLLFLAFLVMLAAAAIARRRS